MGRAKENVLGFTKEELFVVEAALRARMIRLQEHANFIHSHGSRVEVRWYNESVVETEELLKKVTDLL
jgi:hypothetical protein